MEVRLNLSFQTVLERRFVDGWKGPRTLEPEEKSPDIKEIGLHQSGEHAYI
jgi:hypothetical protein